MQGDNSSDRLKTETSDALRLAISWIKKLRQTPNLWVNLPVCLIIRSDCVASEIKRVMRLEQGNGKTWHGSDLGRLFWDLFSVFLKQKMKNVGHYLANASAAGWWSIDDSGLVTLGCVGAMKLKHLIKTLFSTAQVFVCEVKYKNKNSLCHVVVRSVSCCCVSPCQTEMLPWEKRKEEERKTNLPVKLNSSLPS